MNLIEMIGEISPIYLYSGLTLGVMGLGIGYTVVLEKCFNYWDRKDISSDERERL